MFIEKIRRCSNNEAKAADALSKADFRFFRKMMPEARPGPVRIPVALSKWIQDPKPDRFLGVKILTEMSRSTRVLGFNT